MLNRKRLAAVARKEALHILRDWRSLALAIAIPVMLILLFGYALNLDIDKVPTVVWDQSHTPASRELLALYDGSPYFTLVGRATSYDEVQYSLDSGHAMVAIIIPSDFARRVDSNQTAQLQVLGDGSDANTGRLVLGYAQAVGMLYNRKLTAARLDAAGRSATAVPVAMEQRAWFNADLRSTNNIIPGLIAVVMMVIAALLTSGTIAKEWELGTMEQLISTPVRGPELIIGKLVPYFVIGLLDVVIAVVMGQWVFGVPLRGSVALLFALASVFLVGALSMGITISLALKKQTLSTQVALLATYLPTLLLSGFVFSIANMPTAIQALTYIVPARYLIAILRAVYLKGVGLEVIWLNALLLLIWAAFMFINANRRMKLRLS
ncbi:ABC transporter permease [bacterium]|nr:ABC transporter permease [bacterium]